MKANFVIILLILIGILGFIIGYSVAPTDVETVRHSVTQPTKAGSTGGQASGGYGSSAPAPASGGYGSAPAGAGAPAPAPAPAPAASGGYGTPAPATGGYGAPAAGGYGR